MLLFSLAVMNLSQPSLLVLGHSRSVRTAHVS